MENPSRSALLTCLKAIYGISGDSATIKTLFYNSSSPLTAKLLSDKTVLRAVIAAGQTEIVEFLVKFMSEEDLLVTDSMGNTAMSNAAVHGDTKIAQCLFKRNNNLVTILNKEGKSPVQLACNGNHIDTTHYLYSVTPIDFLRQDNGIYGSELLSNCIRHKMFGLKVKQSAASSDDDFSYTSGRAKNNSKNIITEGIQRIYDLKSIHANALAFLRRVCEYTATIDGQQLIQVGVHHAVFKAPRRGITEPIVEIFKTNPDLILLSDDKGRDFFKIATIYRQEKVFGLIYGFDSSKKTSFALADSEGNSLLHLAATLGTESKAKLTPISGAALQMQRELQWFKEMENILPQVHARYKNNEGYTARQLFDGTHKELAKQGEEWMKKVASSSTVVGTLIMTIMFAAAFTVPGGNDQNSGFPIYLTSGRAQYYKDAFMIFIVSDAISLFTSSTSVLMFLGILTSRYAMEDFLISLPKKLIIGLSTLFISIATMMAAFCATLFIMLQGRVWIIIPIILLATIPITRFVWLQFPLLVKIFISTYGAGIFDKKIKLWT
ncbi:ankyrin repeat-containing protein NPR4-like isoform X2 [Durio zibethinus]|uniref:Ankyrin repeat-containing protein NPR4-like isoform X2 n=1 Tax=Durio zibethinus TaxID=66656 RepID=A0A6P5Y916_DURZI|nr:ankyrin repeat-containing protein NPR4-like isoform X2 [Durio zibethinus]